MCVAGGGGGGGGAGGGVEAGCMIQVQIARYVWKSELQK